MGGEGAVGNWAAHALSKEATTPQPQEIFIWFVTM